MRLRISLFLELILRLTTFLALFIKEFIICKPIFGVPVSSIYQGKPVYLLLLLGNKNTCSSMRTKIRMMTVRPYAKQSLVIGYQSMGTLWPVKSPQTAMTPKMLKTALPTIVPMPRSLSVTNVPMMFAKNSGELVPGNLNLIELK